MRLSTYLFFNGFRYYQISGQFYRDVWIAEPCLFRCTVSTDLICGSMFYLLEPTAFFAKEHTFQLPLITNHFPPYVNSSVLCLTRGSDRATGLPQAPSSDGNSPIVPPLGLR